MTTTTDQPGGHGPDDFVPTDELIRRSGVKQFTSLDGLAPEDDPFESDSEHTAFLADLYASRHAGRS
ncbi:MAG: hypothetical protein ABS81_08175 [Pseudonocardia sp. SCN 72-86]|nr:MAG: hypothetical protein ABS81_08175 [Pseudonocardia sp. SCN 72-86]